MNINNSTDTYNVDNSSVTNNTTSNIQNKMVNSCGMTIGEAEQAINIVKDESINTNINNSNTFINTGDNATISDVTLESQLDYVGPEVDKSCVIDAMNELDSQLEAENDNSKEFAGGEGGDVGAKAGGNTTSNENTTDKSDQVDGSTDASQKLTNEAGTTNSTENTTENTADISNEQSNDQSNDVSTSASSAQGLAAGAGAVASSGMGTIIIVIVVILLLIALGYGGYMMIQD